MLLYKNFLRTCYHFFLITYEIFSKNNIYHIRFYYDKFNRSLKYSARVKTSVGALNRLNPDNSLIKIDKSPHYFFVLDFVEKNSTNLEYANSIRSQLNLSAEGLSEKIKTFKNLIECYLQESPNFVPYITTSFGEIIILDGCHRMSILSYFESDIEIEAYAEWVIYPLRKNLSQILLKK